jgi:hypothetical protein
LVSSFAVGAYVIVTVQLWVGFSGDEHVLVCVKLGSPVRETLEIVSGP